MREKLNWIDTGVAWVAYLRDGSDRKYVALKDKEPELYLFKGRRSVRCLSLGAFDSVEAAQSRALQHYRESLGEAK
jgi:hypothetical protein